MRVLQFELRGKDAFFKNPEVNTYFYFTYGNIHKPALLGLLGAIMGYKGYGYEYAEYPEYYEKLKNLKVAVVPKADKGGFSKKIQSFNNSVGYASYEQGGNLIIKERWIENPSWTIYVQLNEDVEGNKLAEMLLEQKCIYMPYLGKNDHPADIANVGIVELEKINAVGQQLSGLIPSKSADFEGVASYRYEEYLPIGLTADTNQYVLEKFIISDDLVRNCSEAYSDGKRNIVFY